MQAGDPNKLGATPVDDGVNFALYSAVAERVELCLFSDDGSLADQIDLPECDENIWHGFMPSITEGQRYGYRVHGAGCNPAKLLIDPYARQLDSELIWHPSIFGSNSDDSAAFAPKGIVRSSRPPLHRAKQIPWSETIFYEANVRGYTMQHPAVNAADRGTFNGMRNKDVIAYLKSLGITSVELLPVHAFADEHHLAEQGLRNFWGYNSINFFAPAPRYASIDPIEEFRGMVNALHDAGLEVILDVVYNHTAESGKNGPTLSFRGIDDRSYYRVADDGEYVNDTGCGNTIDADSPVVQKLILDSLRYWATQMGIDGFRFDLATILGRHADGFNRDHPLLSAISNDSILRNRKLIAEPWDPGPGGYQLGQFPSSWGELNDKFRDATRAYWRGDIDATAELASRLRGSADVFDNGDRKPHASINKITSHDGFTLADVVSYEHRHNEANGEENRDGHSHNYSCNHGVEGETQDAPILAARRRHRLNLLATLLLSQGTPLLLAGDEFGNSQNGNNNAYAQDNEIGWLDWQGLDDDPEFLAAVKSLIRLRRENDLLHLDEFIHGDASEGESQVSIRWINPDGGNRSSEDWGFGHAFGLLLTRSSSTHQEDSVAVIFNAWDEELDFKLPHHGSAQSWQLAFSSVDDDSEIAGRSVTVFTQTRSDC